MHQVKIVVSFYTNFFRNLTAELAGQSDWACFLHKFIPALQSFCCFWRFLIALFLNNKFLFSLAFGLGLVGERRTNTQAKPASTCTYVHIWEVGEACQHQHACRVYLVCWWSLHQSEAVAATDTSWSIFSAVYYTHMHDFVSSADSMFYSCSKWWKRTEWEKGGSQVDVYT